MDEKVSPLKAKPLRQPGQSVQEEMQKILDDKIGGYLMMIAMLLFLIFYSWYIWYQNTIPNPLSITIITLPIIIYCFIKGIVAFKQLKNLKLGRDGEKIVGQELEKLRTQGCMVFHDIVGDNFNIDHVVVSDKGIFLVETKTYSKPNFVNPKVRYEKGQLTINGLGDMSKIITQVKASSTWLKRTLEESTGKTFLIKPVILFPGWFVESPNDSEIWVLEPKQFPYYISKKKEIVSLEDKKLAAYHLSRYIRAL
tara:strand:- start:11238 stop:11996 length:759 start_codon:yes stop_codon:yes gene_type:complete